MQSSSLVTAYWKGSKSLLFISLREHEEHRFPPKGLSGRFSVLESFAMPESLTLGVPCSGRLQTAHLATAFFLSP
jgi:hypothetical protein